MMLVVRKLSKRMLALPPHQVLVLLHAHPMLNRANQKATILMEVVKAKVSRGNTRVPLRAKEAAHQAGNRNHLGKVVPGAPRPEVLPKTTALGGIPTDTMEAPGEWSIVCQDM